MKVTFLLSISFAALLLVILPGARKPLIAARNPSSGSRQLPTAGGNPLPGNTNVEPAVAGSVSWLTVEEATSRLQQQEKPVLIDLYTTWCGWCKQMDKKTYSNKAVAQYLGDKFYTVKVDAESRAVINWQGRSYQFNPQYRCNEFALYLAHGQLEFPTTIIIMPGEEPQAIPGYMEPRDLEPLVKYFGEGDYRTHSFDEYHKHFHATW